MATFHISYKFVNESTTHVITPKRTSPRLNQDEPIEHSTTLSNEIWELIDDDVKRQRCNNKRVDRNSICVTIDTDDGANITISQKEINECFDI